MDITEKIKITLIRNKVLFIVLVVLSLIGSYTHFKLQQVTFKGKMTTTSGGFDMSYDKNLFDFNAIDTINYDVSQKVIDNFSEYNLKRINFKFINDNIIEYEFISTHNFEANEIKALQSDFETLLENGNTIVILKKQLTKNFSKEVEFIDKQLTNFNKVIAKMDSSTFETTDYLMVQEKIYALNKEKINLESKISTLGNLEVVNNLSKFSPIKKPLVLFLVIYLVLAMGIFVIFSKKPS